MIMNALYFSATGTTRKIVSSLVNHLAHTHPHSMGSVIDFTSPKVRQQSASYSKGDLVVVGVPVYAGRVPNVLLKYLNTLQGNGAKAVATVVYGNRNFDDALIELQDILEANGFKVVAAGAFVGEHSFSTTLAGGRPDVQDMDRVRAFSEMVCDKLASQDHEKALLVEGNRPHRPYYKPQNPEGQDVDLRKVTPKTNGDCNNCKLCVSACPMGSIDADDVGKMTGICIKCCACIKVCPVHAKYFDDPDYLRHKLELEQTFEVRREPVFFV